MRRRRRNKTNTGRYSIYKNSYGELRCLCGNRPWSAGIHFCDDKGNLLEDGTESDCYRCDGCGSFVHYDKAGVRDEDDPASYFQG